MKSKRIIRTILALSLAFSTFTALPELTDNKINTAIVASAAEKYKEVDGFVLCKDSSGRIYVSDYKGRGGNITIPKEATYIGEKAFHDNTTIKSVTFPAGTTKYGIGSNAFQWCTNLTTLTFKGSVGVKDTSGIDSGAFIGCHSLKQIYFTDKKAHIGYIGGSAFYSCYALKTIELPDDTGEIYESAFQNCVTLKSITIPKKTVINGSYTFGYMHGAHTHGEYYKQHYNKDTITAVDVKADGNTKVYWEVCARNFDEADVIAKRVFGTGAEVYGYGENDEKGDFKPYEYSFCYPIKQCQITLNVYSGSSAEKWAKKHKIKYKVIDKQESASAQLDAPANLDATKTKSSVTLVWDEVKGASAYKVYKYNSKTGKYEKYKTVSGTMCKVTGLSAGTKYKFKVVSLKKSGSSYIEGEYATLSVTTKK